jgi:hypothetical protein
MHHIIVRGIDRQKIFKDDEDYKSSLQDLGKHIGDVLNN